MDASFTLAADDYAGLLDDVVWRHPWRERLDAGGLDRQLAQQFLFGGRVLINDGYLVSHPVLLKALAERGSLLNRMIAGGHAAIVSIGRPPSASILGRARSGVATHARLVASEAWPLIARMLDALGSEQGSIAWPERDLTPGFARLATRWAAALPGNAGSLRAFVEQFLEKLAKDPRAPRTKWEEHAQSSLAAGALGQGSHDALLHAANQIYHLNFAAALVLSRGEAITASTWRDPALDALLGLEKPAIIAHETPQILVAPGSEAALAETMFTDPPMLALRARFLERWRDEAIARAYAQALDAHAAAGTVILQPLPLLDPDRATLHHWDRDESAGPARIVVTPAVARLLLGDEAASWRGERTADVQ